jgi:hypothetical protein
MARPRQPIELVVSNGKKHLTKSEIEERKKSEVKAPADNAEERIPEDCRRADQY